MEFSVPEYLKEHIESNPDSVNFQVIAGRGKGKSKVGESGFVNYLK